MSDDSTSYFDSEKNYYIFKYVVDPVSGQPTQFEGEIQAFVKATDPWDACEKAGFTDSNTHGATLIDDPRKFVKAIEDERNHLTKISGQLQPMLDEIKAEQKKYFEDRPCPNGCGKLDEKFRCPKCGYGHEVEQVIKDIDKMIDKAKKNGDDTSELETIKDYLKSLNA